MTAPLYSVRPVMTPASARYLDGKTSYWANKKYAKIIMISTGTARKNSTTTELGHRIAGWVDSRPTPSRNPSASASTMDTAAAVNVPCTPGRMYVFHRLAVRNGFHFTASSCPLASSLEYTTHSTSSETITVTIVMTWLRTSARGPGASKRTDDPLITVLCSSRKRSSPCAVLRASAHHRALFFAQALITAPPQASYP